MGTRVSLSGVNTPDTRQNLPGVFVWCLHPMIAREQTRMSARVDRCATLQMPTDSQHWEYRLTFGNRVFPALPDSFGDAKIPQADHGGRRRVFSPTGHCPTELVP